MAHDDLGWEPEIDPFDEPPRVRFSLTESLHLLASVVVLSVAFAMVLGARCNPDWGGSGFGFALDATANIPVLLAYAAAAVVPAFIVHELAHKIVAQRKDMWAEFRVNPIGLTGGLVVTALTGFLFASPGAVEIVGRADDRDEGIISIVGPLVNVGLAAIFVLLDFLFPRVPIQGLGTCGFGALGNNSFFLLIAELNLILALFNMLPIGPLDGRKVWRWSKLAYLGVIVMIAGLAVPIFPVLFTG